ncbi:activase [Acidipropionibacterium jensenii]|uniref:acyl-CoA dehydratase activase-related protein n=1 Tax=Acidipropionibacterium jensenii TaxID=1749 RepID=UPI00110C1EB6|nr:acyl-CoA dehydratase activase-related protein [Acidipropionibacterium jensenii]QCV88921.1 activase [Acidipropionibacterium jensenii]
MDAGRADLRMGLDIGSTTIKAVVFDGDPLTGAAIVFEDYRRHHADITGAISTLLADAAEALPGAMVRVSVTGSAGLGTADALNVPFIQEVMAETAAVQHWNPDADVLLELGGEDAKITYLKPVPEQRMNGSCAGGTGAFIDQMATLLHTDAPGLDDLASRATTTHPIASRCGVFAKSDLQPLINEGARHEDLAASVMRAVATQCIAGLACGRPIRGQVIFLGGPLHFMPSLRKAFGDVLAGKVDHFVTPERAQLYVAMGAALKAESAPLSLSHLATRARTARTQSGVSQSMPPLFHDQAELDSFHSRHARTKLPARPLSSARGDLFLGIDAGSTTIKSVLLDDSLTIVASHYASNEGDPVNAAVGILADLYDNLPEGARIARTCTTGYGEGLVKAALGAEDGEVETMAHYRAAEHLCPGVTSIIDIGGQDMKYLRVFDNCIDSISVNEACSSGCGSFLQTFAAGMDTDIRSFAQMSLLAEHPVDLGSRCTVFMNSSVKQAQKEGATPSDIAAGLSYSVVRNALYKVIKLTDPAQLGERVVVQGGTFLNDAVLRAFELLTGHEVVRPDEAGLMGAYGAAMTARARFHAGEDSDGVGLRDRAELDGFAVETHRDDCTLCQNHCQRTISTFSDGRVFVSGNRCDRGAEVDNKAAGRRPKSELPNVFEAKYKRLFSYRRLTAKKAFRGDLGLPRALNMYENYPFWFTTLSALGYRVMISGRSSHELFDKGMESIASENICYPAKLNNGHIEDLIERGVKRIFDPCIRFEQVSVEGADNHFNCPVVASYPEVIRANVEDLRDKDVELLSPFLSLADPEKLAERLAEVFAEDGVSYEEAREAIDKGLAEDASFHADIRQMGEDALAYMSEHQVPGIVLAGRPYHVDPEIHHGIPEMANSLGLAVLTEDSVAHLGADLLERPLRVRDQWMFHSRLYQAAAFVASRKDLEIVQLNSFGCGLDAITTDQVREIMAARDRIYTTLKIDEVSNLGAARIRLRSLHAAAKDRQSHPRPAPTGHLSDDRVPFTKEMKATHTILVPQLAPYQTTLAEAALRSCGYRVEVLETAPRSDIEYGLSLVNNDACFPAIVVIGQLVSALRSGRYDLEHTTLFLTQTGGMCRATNYIALLRKGLKDAGFGAIPVIAASLQGVEENPGFSLTGPLVHRMVQAISLGDLLQKVHLRTRPYEAVAGSADALMEHWTTICREHFTGSGHSQTLGGKTSYRRLIAGIVSDFDALELRDIARKPRVGVLGEILVQFHPDANNHIVETIEAEDCEAVLPGLMWFVYNCLSSGDYNYKTFGTDKWGRHIKKAFRALLLQYQKPIDAELARSERFEVSTPITTLMSEAQKIVELGNQAGEGWYLVGEMVDMIRGDVPNIACVQPFACLPNHVTGRGIFRELRRQYPQANIVSVDYDPGASQVNQLNRIKLMAATARDRNAAPAEDIPTSPATAPVVPQELAEV